MSEKRKHPKLPPNCEHFALGKVDCFDKHDCLTVEEHAYFVYCPALGNDNVMTVNLDMLSRATSKHRMQERAVVGAVAEVGWRKEHEKHKAEYNNPKIRTRDAAKLSKHCVAIKKLMQEAERNAIAWRKWSNNEPWE